MLALLGCPPPHNPYWDLYGFIFCLLTWGIVMRRRERIEPRTSASLLAALGWCYAIVRILTARRLDDDEVYLVGLQATSLTTVCVYLEIIFGRRAEPIPRARAINSDPPVRRS